MENNEIALYGVSQDELRASDGVRFSDGTVGMVGNPAYNPDGSLRIIPQNRSLIDEMAQNQMLYNTVINQLSIQMGGTLLHNTIINPYGFYSDYEEDDQIIK